MTPVSAWINFASGAAFAVGMLKTTWAQPAWLAMFVVSGILLVVADRIESE